ncbi:hypothetical protein ABID56_001153 [Alkalibacillus flavidus]|uniref:NERD domain-containing protein n=1 Tax=Alkalibacillus flavidus TaxID=546021 RepID=A0ABV2KU08_9BACI
MIILPLKKNHELEQLELLVPRYKSQDSTFQLLQEKLGRERAGYKGEKNVQHFLNSLQISDLFVLYGYRSFGVDSYFQIDTLLITTHFILIIESKHIRGTLSLNDFNQLIQHYNGTKTVFNNPLMQAKVQRYQLTYLLQKLQLNHLPIHTCATFTHSKAELNFSQQSPNMFPVQNLLSFIHQLFQSQPDPLISKQQAMNIARTLKDYHQPREVNLLEELEIDNDLISKGVRCTNPLCQHSKMTRVHGNWQCNKCQYKDRFAHLQTFKEFAIIYGTRNIINQQAKSFLNIDSPQTTKRLLSILEKLGDNKGRIYKLDSLF